MTNLISGAIASISAVLQGLQVKRLITVLLVGLVILTSNIEPGRSNPQAVTKELNKVVHQDDSQRPKTVGEWNKEARETKDAPGERLQKIGKESAEAIKDMGSLYPNTAERTASEQPQGRYYKIKH